MPRILSVGTAVPPHEISQETSQALSRQLFEGAFSDLDRLLKVFANSGIRKRHFCVPPEWFLQPHSFAEKNRIYVEAACELGESAIQRCLDGAGIAPDAVDCIVFVSTTGLATPSIDARLLNRLPFREDVTRVPLWGLGCAAGAMGMARAAEIARARPDALVLLLSVELCGLTFVMEDRSKSNLIATSLFGDGAAAVLIAGDDAAERFATSRFAPEVVDSRTVTWRGTLDVMGWELAEEGLKVIFSRDIPVLIDRHLKPRVREFLARHRLEPAGISRYILHPGGAKVISAYRRMLDLTPAHTRAAEEVLAEYGNMSSATVLFVLERQLRTPWPPDEAGLVSALGPGFSAEMILLKAGR